MNWYGIRIIVPGKNPYWETFYSNAQHAFDHGRALSDEAVRAQAVGTITESWIWESGGWKQRGRHEVLRAGPG